MKSVIGTGPMNVEVRSRVMTLAVTLSLVGALLLVPLAEAGATSPPVINSLTASSALVAPEGHAITLSATVSNGGTCTLSVKPAVTGFPVTEDCIPIPGKPKKLTFPGSLPSNASGKLVTYHWTLAAQPQGSTAKVTKSVTVVEEAYAVTLKYKATALTGQPSRMSCATTTFCVAISSGIGGGAFVQKSGVFTPIVGVPKSGWTDVSCATATMCVLIDGGGNYYLYNGHSLSGKNPLYEVGTTKLANLTSVSCSSATFCMVVASDGSTFSSAPAKLLSSASLPPRPAAVQTLVSCTSPTYCVAVDADGDSYAFNGSSWTGPTTVSGPSDPLVSVSCRESPTKRPPCITESHAGFVWTIMPPDASTGAVPLRESPSKASIGKSVSCANANFCLVSDGTSVYQVVRGLLGGRVLLSGGSDSSGASCVAVPSTTTSMTCSSTGKTKELTGHVTLVK